MNKNEVVFPVTLELVEKIDNLVKNVEIDLDMSLTEQKFWAKVNKTDTCWLWTACTNYGYGIFRVDKKKLKAHRYSWSLINGTIPKNNIIMHKCDVTQCVNPEHLKLGSQKENITDMVQKGRNARREKHGRTTLSQIDINQIRRLIKAGDLTQKAIAEQYNLTQAAITYIKQGRNWPITQELPNEKDIDNCYTELARDVEWVYDI